ncbi:hypothetical protein SCUP234_10623 [Seiridium cupressi]
MAQSPAGDGIMGRVRSASLSIMQTNPQLGMWQATGTAIAQAPNLTELGGSELGDKIEFTAHGHSALTAVRETDGNLVLTRTQTALETVPEVATGPSSPEQQDEARYRPIRSATLAEIHQEKPKNHWKQVVANGFKALWTFFLTPSGFFIVIYFLNIVAWGAMLFFLLLKAAPAMNYPTADDDNSPRKKWLEIDSQILNALFCVTGFGLAPWRFRDLYFYIRAAWFHDKVAMRRLAAQNKGWFRPPTWASEMEENDGQSAPGDEEGKTTFTGKAAPPTAVWKLGFNTWMMVLNTGFQVVLSYFMWAYNRLDRPSWATGTFIGLGCGVSMFAGLMSWWEGRKVKKIEGPKVRIVDTTGEHLWICLSAHPSHAFLFGIAFIIGVALPIRRVRPIIGNFTPVTACFPAGRLSVFPEALPIWATDLSCF